MEMNVILNRLLSSKFSECNEDITAHLQSLEVDLPHDDLATCPNANKRWLIRNRLQMQIDDDAIVCGKHISKYGITFKPSMLCAYPSHTKKT